MKHALLLTGAFFSAHFLLGQTGTVADFQKVSAEAGNLETALSNSGGFGYVMESQNDSRIFAASPYSQNGEFLIIDLNDDGSVSSEFLVSTADFSYFDNLTNSEFGAAVVDIGDLNSDNLNELIVGAPGIDGGKLFALSSQAGTYQLEELFLSTEIATTSERLGEYLAFEQGVLYATSMHNEGSIYRFGGDIFEGLALLETIDVNHPLLGDRLDEGDQFGSGLSITDVNQDGNMDILCGAPGDDDQDTNFGAVYILYGSNSETLADVQKISRIEGDFGGFLNVDDEFGSSVRAIGDLDENGSIDLAVGAPGDDDGGMNVGSVWILFMHSSGWVINEKKINRFEGNFTFDLATEDQLAARIATVGDLNGDGTIDLVVSAEGDDNGGTNRGAFYTIFIERCPAPSGDYDFEIDGASVSFFAEGGEDYSYIWNFDDGGFSEAQNPVYTYQNTGIYMVCLVINNGCGGDNFCKNVQITSLLSSTELEREKIKLYPNPASAQLNLTGLPFGTAYRVTDITGKVVKKGIYENQNWLDVSNFNEGLYLVEVISNGQKVVKKFQVAR
jgi:hypothetical protein